jgi:hypothetical protein
MDRKEAQPPSQPDQVMRSQNKIVFGDNKCIETPTCFSDYSARFDGCALLCDLCFFRLQCARKTAGDDE